LVTEFCLGLGLDADLTGEKVEAEMKAFTVQNIFPMNLSLGVDDAQLIGDKEEEEEEEDDEGNEEQQQQGGEGVQHGTSGSKACLSHHAYVTQVSKLAHQRSNYISSRKAHKK